MVTPVDLTSQTVDPEPAPVRAGIRRWWVAGLRDRLPLFGLLAVLAFTATVHLWNLDRTGLRGDEAVYSGQAAVLAGADGYARHFLLASRGNSNFLLYQELLGLLYRVFGVSDVAGRLLSAVLSTATVLLVYLIGRTLYSRSAALLAAFLLGISSYALSLGRLALLDPLAALLFTAAVLLLVRWDHDRRAVWLVAFAATAALAIQAKVVGSLLGVVFVVYLVITQSWRSLRARPFLLATAAFALCCVPALVQLLGSAGQLSNFLRSSLLRHSDVPWYYYLKVLVTYEGPALVALWIGGVLFAVFRHRKPDVVPLLVVVLGGVFFQFYPLKAFNYLLVLIPTMCVLGGRALAELATPGRLQPFRLALVAGAVVALSVLAVPRITAVLEDNTAAGLREASRWLADHSAAGDGVMTLSHGSAQYVFSFYGHQDAYPFGRFQLATVLPGGQVLQPAPDPRGGTPRDWVTFQPTRLLRAGTVRYLVYYNNKLAGLTPQTEDGTESPLVYTSTQRRFHQLIATYGGRLVHTVEQDGEPVAWVYEVGRERPHPTGSMMVSGAMVHVTGIGFTRNAQVRLAYHNKVVASAETGSSGDLDTSFPLPMGLDPTYRLVATDEAGVYVSLTGIPKPTATLVVQNGHVRVDGGFTPHVYVVATYHGRAVATGFTDDKGRVTFSFPMPSVVRPRYQLTLVDSVGNSVTLTGLHR